MLCYTVMLFFLLFLLLWDVLDVWRCCLCRLTLWWNALTIPSRQRQGSQIIQQYNITLERWWHRTQPVNTTSLDNSGSFSDPRCCKQELITHLLPQESTTWAQLRTWGLSLHQKQSVSYIDPSRLTLMWCKSSLSLTEMLVGSRGGMKYNNVCCPTFRWNLISQILFFKPHLFTCRCINKSEWQ